MNLGDSITASDTDGLSVRGVNALNSVGIFYWKHAKKAHEDGMLRGIRGVGEKTAAAVIKKLYT